MFLLLSRSFSCKKDRDNIVKLHSYIVKSFSGFEIIEVSTALPVIKL